MYMYVHATYEHSAQLHARRHVSVNSCSNTHTHTHTHTHTVIQVYSKRSHHLIHQCLPDIIKVLIHKFSTLKYQKTMIFSEQHSNSAKLTVPPIPPR